MHPRTVFVIGSLVCLLLALTVPVTAPAVEILSPFSPFTSLSATIRHSTLTSFVAADGVLTTPDFTLGFALPFHINNDLSCFGPAGTCPPGALVRGFASGNTVIAGLTYAGQMIGFCGPSGLPFSPFPVGPCVGAQVEFLSFGPAVLPPFLGDTEATAAGSFAALLGFGIFNDIPPVPLGGLFIGSGTTLFHLEWQPQTETWRVLYAEANIYNAPIPEPATFLLFGTTAAGLGPARLYRRRGRERQHAA